MNRFARTAVMLSFACYSWQGVHAQLVHHNLLETSPVALNPAFAGMTNAALRIGANMQQTSNDQLTDFSEYQVSVDAPVHYYRNGDYWGLGAHGTRSIAGDGTLSGYSGYGAISFHKALGRKVGRGVNRGRRYDLGIGLEGGYMHSGLDFASLYFDYDLMKKYFRQTVSGTMLPGPFNSTNVNFGVSFSHTVSRGLNYVGLAK